MSIIFEPLAIGPYTAKNRIFMAPMSRYRSDESGIVPDIMVEYYRQRASAGLIIAESTRVNNWSGGMNCPGLYTAKQASSWKKVTNAVHEEGGLIFAQLWHAGRAAHESLMPKGRDVIAPSAIASSEETMIADGMALPTPPRALTKEEIAELRDDFANASQYALDAGFDGVEIHGAGGFLIDTFLQESTNNRDDIYGGSDDNRFRFLAEILDDAITIWGAQRVAVKISPTSHYNDVGHGDILASFKPVLAKLNSYGLAFLEVNEAMPFSDVTEKDQDIITELQAMWDGPYIANGGYDSGSGAVQIDAGKADAISYGRPFLANPDLPRRYAQNAPLNEAKPATFYGGDHQGYTDYPFLD